jgi:hypothetical protein
VRRSRLQAAIELLELVQHTAHPQDPLSKPSSASTRAASIIAATPPFMSCEPRP